jgi:hypothetical protein
MRKILLIVLSLLMLVNLVLLIIAQTQPSSSLYPNRLVISLSFIMIGGFWRQHVQRYNKLPKE